MRNSEIVLCIDYQENSAMISMALEQDYGLIGKIHVSLTQLMKKYM